MLVTVPRIASLPVPTNPPIRLVACANVVP